MKTLYLFITLISAQILQAQTLKEFHKDYYAQLCHRIIECADHVGIAENLMLTRITSEETCIGVFTQMDNVEKWQKPIAAKTALFNPKEVMSCLTALSKTSCESIAGRVMRPAAINGCETTIVGTIKEFDDCNSHLSCQANNAACYGNCRTPLLECDDQICGENQYCDFDKSACETLKGVGQSCNNFSECSNNNCVDGQCKAPRPVLKNAAACGGEHSNICPIGEFCNDKNCVPYRKKGESCSTKYDDYLECEALLQCENNRCVK